MCQWEKQLVTFRQMEFLSLANLVPYRFNGSGSQHWAQYFILTREMSSSPFLPTTTTMPIEVKGCMNE
jgi:hypothetical protein